MDGDLLPLPEYRASGARTGRLAGRRDAPA
jgi:hypothetical protein